MDLPARTAALAAVAIVALGGTSVAQTSRRTPPPRPGFEVALALPSVLLEDGNGATVRSGVAPVIGVSGAWTLMPQLHSMVGIRWSIASVSVDEGGAEWKAGRTSQLAIRAGLERRFDSRLGVSLALGGTRLSGPKDVWPFRYGSGWKLAGDAGVSWRMMRSRPLSLFGALESFLLTEPPITDNPGAQAGWVRRIVVGARHGR